jgi:cyclic-di-GMP-binding protein
MPSFDVVSEVNLQELDNAINQTIKEIAQRYDFKNSKTTVEWKAKEKEVVIVADDDYKLGAAKDILQSKLIKRNVPIKNLDYGTVEQASGSMMKQVIKVKQGIDKDSARKITQVIKDAKLKVQAQVMDDQVRVTSKNIDDLQDTIRTLRASALDVELQFTNMRN